MPQTCSTGSAWSSPLGASGTTPATSSCTGGRERPAPEPAAGPEAEPLRPERRHGHGARRDPHVAARPPALPIRGGAGGADGGALEGAAARARQDPGGAGPPRAPGREGGGGGGAPEGPREA